MTNDKMKILLVEDDPFLLGMYAAKFELANFKVIIATDGEKAYQAAKKESFDIILLDVVLPKINGLEVLQKFRAGKENKTTPVVMLTNLSQKNEVDEALRLGAVDYLIKAHFMPSEVVEKIKTILKK